MSTMKAAVRDRYGPPAVVRTEEVERPIPTGDQVLVRVVSASVNRADLDNLYPRWRILRLALGVRAPRNRRIGSDVAGEVDSIGPDVTAFKPGDRVVGDLFEHGLGAFAEYAIGPQRAWAALPATVTFEEAATLPHSAILALQGLRLRNGRTPKPGDHVLVDGASGSVGPFAVQIAKSFGAQVTGTCRTAKMDYVRSLGADHVIDYTASDYTASGERYDWILDVDAHHSMLDARRALKRGGVYLTLGGSGLRIIAAMLAGPAFRVATGRRMGLMFWWKPFNPADVATVLRLVENGTVRPSIDRTFTLDQAADALRWVDDGRAKGKVLILPVR
jgi:NADPH:quinone reductase-like Zn-dependent oxidoreductase